MNAWLAEELAKRHEVTVLTSRAFDLPAESIERDVRVIRVPVFFRRRHASANFASMLAYLPMGVLRGRRLMRRQSFDIINTHFALPTGPVGHMLSRSGGIPNVLSVHGGDLYDPSKRSSPHNHAALRSCVRRLALAADSVVAQSENTLANLHQFFAPEAPAQIIPLGIPRPPPSARPARNKYGFEDSDVILVTVGRLVGRKAVDQLIDVVADMSDARVRLVVVGAGPCSDSLAAQAEHRGVSDQIRFTGMVSDVIKQEILAISDGFVSTSQHEGFGLVFLEAMGAGLPVVCYDRGGQTDFLRDGETGHLVALNDRAGFLDSCRHLAEERAWRATVGQHNKQLVERYYIENCAQQYESLFETVIRQRDFHDCGRPGFDSSKPS